MILTNKTKKTFGLISFLLNIKIIALFAGVICFTLPSFSQVKKRKKVEKIKKDSYNFYDAANVQNKQKRDRDFYVVYSDQSLNNTYLDAYAQKRGVKQPFLKPYFVLDQENDYVELVAYDPTLIGKPKGLLSVVSTGRYTFSDTKQINYIGWIHKNRLLHFDHAKLSDENYRPVRFMLGIEKVNTLFNITKYVKKDTVTLYTDPSFKRKSTKFLMLKQIVYLYKYNHGHTAALISNKSRITDADSTERIMGWVPAEMIKYIGQQQVFNIKNCDSLVFYNDGSQFDSTLYKYEIGSDLIFNTEKNKTRTVKKNDTVNVMIPISVWDHRANKLTNVEGDELLISDIDEIKKQNKNINFHFIFDCSEDTRAQQISLMTSLQRIWLLYTENELYTDFNFTFSTSSYGCAPFYTFDKNESFPLWIDYLDRALNNDTSLVTPETNFIGIEKCFDYYLSSIDSTDFSNNILLISGAEKLKRIPKNKKEDIIYLFAQSSSRLIFFQLENTPDDSHQEYILQAKNLLGETATAYNGFIKKYIVDNKLVKEENTFISIPGKDNIYVYDSPTNSNYQGGIVFPPVNKELNPTSFDQALDSVLIMAIKTNLQFTNSLDYYNSKLGFLRSKPSRYIKDRVLNDSVFKKNLSLIPRINTTETYNEDRVVCVDENELIVGYLLSETELEILIDNYKSLVPLFSKKMKRKQRRKVYRIYRINGKNLNDLFLNRDLNSRDKISELIYTKTGIPVQNQLLQDLKVRHIKRKRKIQHEEFDQLLRELRRKIEILENIYTHEINATYAYDRQLKYYFILKENLF